MAPNTARCVITALNDLQTLQERLENTVSLVAQDFEEAKSKLEAASLDKEVIQELMRRLSKYLGTPIDPDDSRLTALIVPYDPTISALCDLIDHPSVPSIGLSTTAPSSGDRKTKNGSRDVASEDDDDDARNMQNVINPCAVRDVPMIGVDKICRQQEPGMPYVENVVAETKTTPAKKKRNIRKPLGFTDGEVGDYTEAAWTWGRDSSNRLAAYGRDEEEDSAAYAPFPKKARTAKKKRKVSTVSDDDEENQKHDVDALAEHAAMCEEHALGIDAPFVEPGLIHERARNTIKERRSESSYDDEDMDDEPRITSPYFSKSARRQDSVNASTPTKAGLGVEVTDT